MVETSFFTCSGFRILSDSPRKFLQLSHCFLMSWSSNLSTVRASLSFSLTHRVINAGKSMLNEDQASCEKLFVKKPNSKHRNSTLLEDNRVSEWKPTIAVARSTIWSQF